MACRVCTIDPVKPDPALLREAAELLRRGGLVAFPTETVYGLGGHALDPDAVARIFAAKQRPATNPVIVHVADAAAARALASRFPEQAEALAERFWPGPLTLVVPKAAAVPDLVTAGGPTVGLRVPAHPVALELLRTCAIPIAAPSANPATVLSPTTAAHVAAGLGDRVELVLDAGATPGGLESTVLDVTVTPPRLLRPGLVTPIEIEAVVGPIQRDAPSLSADEPARSPGQQLRHYAPRTPLETSADGAARVAELLRQGGRIGWVTRGRPALSDPLLVVESLPDEPAGYAANLYAALHRLDAAAPRRIVVDLPPVGEEWLAVHDRLRRAASD